MATLTNTKIKDTYDGLLKTTDNQAIDASGVTLIEDGLGNASALSVGRSGNGVTITGSLNATLATAAQPNITSVGTLSSLAVSGNLTVDTNTLFVDAANNWVGIGTSSPSRPIHILAPTPGIKLEDTTGNDFGEIVSVDGDLYIRADEGATQASSSIRFQIDQSEKVRIDSSGRVGIGTSSPASLLHIYNSSSAEIKLETTAGSALLRAISDTLVYRSDSHIFQSEGGTERMRIDSSGRVGIGTSSPASNLHIEDNDPKITLRDTSGASNAYFQILAAGGDGQVATLDVDPNNVASGSFLNIKIDATERLRILSSGGITFNGDTAAANALDDYEEGSFTPVYTTVNGDFDTIDYSVQEGNYTKIGRVVYCDLFVRGGNITYSGAVTSTSNVRIGGLPFTAIAGLDAPGASISHVISWGNTNNPNAARQQPSTTQINLHQLRDTANVYTIKVSDLNLGAADTLNDIRMSFFYNVP
jgi:hypothetical protein